MPDTGELIRKFNNVTTHIDLLLSRRLERARATVADLAARRSLTDPEGLLAERRMLISYLSDKMTSATEAGLLSLRGRFGETAAKLEAMSPLAILKRGYAVALSSGGDAVRSVNAVCEGDALTVRLADGEAETRVISTRRFAE